MHTLVNIHHLLGDCFFLLLRALIETSVLLVIISDQVDQLIPRGQYTHK